MKLQWDKVGERLYETGVSNGILFVMDTDGNYQPGVAWNGLINVQESPSGGEDNPQYADNVKYLNLKSATEFGGNIECFYYPDEFKVCDGSADLGKGVTVAMQNRRTFGLAYKTQIGNDIEGADFGYKWHLVYGASVSPTERSFGTINDSPEASTMSYAFTTTPILVEGFKPTALVVIDSTLVDAAKLTAFEEVLLGGGEASESKLPLPDELATMFAQA